MTKDLALPADYPALLADLKTRVRAAQHRAHRTVNTEMLTLYWQIGDAIRTRQRTDGWGARVIDRLAADLRAEFPNMTGLNRRNLYYMRAFAAASPDPSIVQTPSARLSWSHLTLLLDKLDDQAARDWYADAADTGGWSVVVLEHQIMNQTRERFGVAPSSFAAQLEPADSELAQQLAKDPYVFDFLGLSAGVAERDVEQAMMDRIVETLRELGTGFAFVGRQVHLVVGDDDFYVDLIFFHTSQLRFVVVELKVGKFSPENLGQLQFYVAVVDDRMREPDKHQPTIGLLLCTDRDETVVRYALGSSTAPMAVSTYTYDTLPAAERAALPSETEVVRALQSVTATVQIAWNAVVEAEVTPAEE